MSGNDFNDAAGKSGLNIDIDDGGKTLLHLAAEAGNIKEATRLLHMGARPDRPDDKGDTPIFAAVRRQDKQMIELLRQSGASLRLLNKAEDSLLDCAIAQGADIAFLDYLRALGTPVDTGMPRELPLLHATITRQAPLETVAWVIAQGVDINAKDKKARTPLHIALTEERSDIFRLLLDCRANPTLRNEDIATPLHIAAEKANVDALRLLLEIPAVRHNINAFKTMTFGFTPLHEAIYRNNGEIIDLLVAAGADIHAEDNQNRQPLFLAVEIGHPEMVEKMIDLGADVTRARKSNLNQTPLVHAIYDKKYEEILRMLHRHGVNLDARDGSGATALHKAAERHEYAQMYALLSLGADANALNRLGKRAIDIVAEHYVYYSSEECDKIIALLLLHGANPNHSPDPSCSQSPLHGAALGGRTEIIEKLLLFNADVNAEERRGDNLTPLMVALRHGNMPAVELLFAKGANINHVSRAGKNMLHVTAENNSLNGLEFVLQHATLDVNAQDFIGRAPLHYAAGYNRPDIARRLIGLGADPYLQDKEGFTPLHLAADNNNPSIVAIYEDTLADKTDWNAVVPATGMTALHLAAKAEHPNIIEAILRHSPDQSLRDATGMTALHHAVRKTNAEIVFALLKSEGDRGSSPEHLTDHRGRTALHYAAEENSSIIFDYLVKAGCSTDKRDNDGNTPLHLAVAAGRYDMAGKLISEFKADVFAQNGKNISPLDLALQSDNEHVKELILKEAARVEALKTQPTAALRLPRPKH